MCCHTRLKAKSIILQSSFIIIQDMVLGDSIELKANKHCIQVDDKKDEDVVAVLLDEPAPEGQKEIVFRLSVNYKPTAHTVT